MREVKINLINVDLETVHHLLLDKYYKKYKEMNQKMNSLKM